VLVYRSLLAVSIRQVSGIAPIQPIAHEKTPGGFPAFGRKR
jgi:hypothetical protein